MNSVTSNIPIPTIYTSITYPNTGYVIDPKDVIKLHFADKYLSQHLSTRNPTKLPPNQLITGFHETEAYYQHPWSVIAFKDQILETLNNYMLEIFFNFIKT